MARIVERPSKEMFVRLWHDTRLTRAEVARRLDVSESCARQMAIEFGLSARRPGTPPAMGVNVKTNDPTPDEIRERCLEVQARWNDAETQGRARVGLRCYAYDGRTAAFTAYGM